MSVYEIEVETCPACGDPVDHCEGHGSIGDPRGFHVIRAHDAGEHGQCHEHAACRTCEVCDGQLIACGINPDGTSRMICEHLDCDSRTEVAAS